MFETIITIILLSVLAVMASVKKIADARDLRRRVDNIKRRQYLTPRSIEELSLRRKPTDEQGGLAYIFLKLLPNSKRVEELLMRAGVKITAKKFIMYCAGATVVIFAIVYIFFGQNISLALPAALFIGMFIPLKILKLRIYKITQAFLHQFPDAIDLIVRGLRSGLPVSESIVQVSTELPDPVRSIFANIANNMKLGVSLEKSLIETAKKLEIQEFYFFTTSIVLQRETGGNLSEILNNLSDVLRSRFIMKTKIHALTSEARASAYIIGALPFVVTLAISFVSPAYLRPLFDEEGGHTALMVASGMLVSGVWIMNRMAKFEI